MRAERPEGESSSGKMAVNVFESASISAGVEVLMNFERIDGEEDSVGVARTCCTFLAPASWVRMLGHLMAFERSIWRRACHAVAFG